MSTPTAEPCYRCGHPAELPAVGHGNLAGHDAKRVPLCGDCLALLMADAEAFWAPLRQKRQEG